MNFDSDFINNYWMRYQKIFSELKNDDSIIKLRDAIRNTSFSEGRLIFVGNGASASLASHAATDFTKQAKIPSIAFNDHNLITALSNDYGYENWVTEAIKAYLNKNDMVILISSSGNSKNIVNAAKHCKKNSINLITFSGFKKNNPLSKLGNVNFYINSRIYNFVEMAHHIILVYLVDYFTKGK